MFWHNFCSHHIGKYGRGQTGGVGIDEEEKGIIGKQLGTELYQRVDRILDLPDLAFRAAAV